MKRRVFSSAIHVVKFLFSSLLVLAALLYIADGMSSDYLRIPLPGGVNMVLLFLSIIFLGFFESGQVAVVNLSKIDHNQSFQLETSQPIAYSVYRRICVEGTIERYLLGRQLCVIVLVFIISILTSYPSMPIYLPHPLHHLLITTGLPGVILTMTFGQLLPQLLADEYTIRFLNIPGSKLFLEVALLMERIGIFTQFSWLVDLGIEHCYCKDDKPIVLPVISPVLDMSITSKHGLLAGEQSTQSNENAADTAQPAESSTSNDTPQPPILPTALPATSAPVHPPKLSDISTMPAFVPPEHTSLPALLKHVVSALLTLFAFVVVLNGIFMGYAVFQGHPFLQLVLLVFSLTFIFYLEGLQVACLSAQHLQPHAFLASQARAIAAHRLITSRSDVVKRFLMGRQFLVVLAMFTVASLTTYTEYPQTLFHPMIFQPLVHTGFSGIMLTLNSVQMPSQMLAKKYPQKFLNLWGAGAVIQVSLWVESIGITHCSWGLFMIMQKYVFE